MKMYNKDKMQYENGMILDKKGRVIVPNPRVHYQLNQLEELLQEACNNRDIEKRTELVKIMMDENENESNFKRVYEREMHAAELIDLKDKVDTPTINAKVKEAKSFMEEIERMRVNNNMHLLVDKFADLIEWVCAKKVCMEFAFSMNKFDLPMLGNPLELDKSDVTSALCIVAKHGKIDPSFFDEE